LGHIAVRRRRTVRFLRADQMFRILKAARLDNSVEAEMRALARVDVLILDDLALQAMDATETVKTAALTGDLRCRWLPTVCCGRFGPRGERRWRIRSFGVDDRVMLFEAQTEIDTADT
jgi:hypothetical protein